MLRSRTVAMIAAMLLAPSLVLSQEFFIYPKDGQSPDQQKQDEFECYDWAKGQSGFDPMAPPTASRPPPQKEAQKGGVGRGALGGAAAGAVVGAITGDTKKGAATGALVGGARRSNQRKSEEAAQQNWENEQVGQYQANRNNYNRAYSACLTGRGYTVN